jgi:glycosyltransferase involved in cell wall biosynthesis
VSQKTISDTTRSASKNEAISPTFSFVLPVHNEDECLEHLYLRLSAVMDQLPESCEAIMVDDGSTDNSFEVMRAIRLRDQRFKLVQLSRNFGHQAAITAGLDLALGKAIVVMDADLQHPPELVPAMVARWREGFEVVNAVCENRGGTHFKRLSAWAFYRLLRRLAQVDMSPNVGDFRLIDRSVLDVFKTMRENTRYLRGMFSWVGFRQTTVPYEYHYRFKGKPKYNLPRMMRLGVDGIASFSHVPLQIALHVGFFVAALSFLAGVSDITAKIAGGSTVPGWLSLAITVSFLGGMQLVILGIMGTYMGRMYDEVKNRPLYVVRELAGIGQPENQQTKDLVTGIRQFE